MIKRLSAIMLGAALILSLPVFAQTEEKETAVPQTQVEEAEKTEDVKDMPVNNGGAEKPSSDVDGSSAEKAVTEKNADMPEAAEGSVPDTDMKNGEMPNSGEAGEMPSPENGGMYFPQPPSGEQPPENFQMQDSNAQGNTEQQQGRGNRQGGGMGGQGGMNPDMFGGQGGGFPGGEMPGTETATTDTSAEVTETKMSFSEIVTTYSTPIFSVVLLAIAFVFVIFYKRKKF